MDFVDWLLSEQGNSDIEPMTSKKYKSYRFKNLAIKDITVENYKDMMVSSLAKQVEIFLPHLYKKICLPHMFFSLISKTTPILTKKTI